ncbi:MAG: DUF3306 domain-containing protein [Burkholderiales bacterium]
MSEFRRGETFLSRWSRRKKSEPENREREDQRVQEESNAASGAAAPAAVAPESALPKAAPADLPSIDSLTPDSDFSRFMRPDVPLASRNAAMKKLFTDPHFNVMDGLDTYIDDYTVADPIPPAMLRELAQSQMLKLFDSEDEKKQLDGEQGASLEAQAAPVEDQTQALAATDPVANNELSPAHPPVELANQPPTS